MTISPWITAAKIIVPIEGACGMLLNFVLFFALYDSKLEKAAKLYRISSMITATSGFYISFLILVIVSIPITVNFSFADATYGRLLFYLSPRANELLFVANLAQCHAMWEMIPAPSIVQWTSLARPNYSTARRVFCAYSLPVIFYINSWYNMSAFIPDEEYKVELAKSVYALHGTTQRDCHIYGIRMIDENGIDLRDVIVFDVMPSYFTCYGLFAFCAIEIRKRLLGLGKTASRKTVLMQQRFFRVQVAQVFLPLVLLSPPLTIAIVCALLSMNVANVTVAAVFMIYLSPSATALLLLAFAVKTNRISRKISSNLQKIASVTSKPSKSS